MVFLMMILLSVSYANTDINVVIDEEAVELDEAYGKPFVDENNRTQVPLRAVLETFGAQVGWIAESSTATITYEKIVIEVPIGKDYILVDGIKKMNDTKSII